MTTRPHLLPALATLILLPACAPKPSPSPTAEDEQKFRQQAEEREYQYNQFVIQLRRLEPGRTTTEDVNNLLGPPASTSGAAWIYQLHLAPSGPPEQFILTFHGNILASIASSGSRYYQPR